MTLLALAGAWGDFGASGLVVAASKRPDRATMPNPRPVLDNKSLRVIVVTLRTGTHSGSSIPAPALRMRRTSNPGVASAAPQTLWIPRAPAGSDRVLARASRPPLPFEPLRPAPAPAPS